MTGKKKIPKTTREKSFEVLVNTPEAQKKIKGFVDDKGKKMMFNRHGQMVIHDSGLAQDLKAQFGTKKDGKPADITVIPVEGTQGRTPRKAFSVPKMPWKDE